MRVEWKDTEDIENAGQFIIYAESKIEGAILRRFIEKNTLKGWKFWIHGSCYSCDLRRHTSFNFGFRKESNG